MTTFQKTIKYAALTFAVCLAVFIITAIMDAVIMAIDGVSGTDGKSVTESHTYHDIHSIDVDMGLGDITIRSEGSEFIVNANDVWGFEIKENSGSLKIETGSHNFISGSSDSSLEIIVPKDYVLDSLTVEVGVGKCVIEDIDTVKADFDTGVGELNCTGLTAGKCKFDSGIGAVSVSFKGSISDYSIALDKGIGSATINGESYSESTHKNKGAKNTIDLDCGIGGIDIKFED